MRNFGKNYGVNVPLTQGDKTVLSRPPCEYVYPENFYDCIKILLIFVLASKNLWKYSVQQKW